MARCCSSRLSKLGRSLQYDRARRGKGNQLDPLDCPLQHRAPGKFDQRGMKREVQIPHTRPLRRLWPWYWMRRCMVRNAVHLVVDLPDPVQRARIGQPLGRQPGRRAFQHAARFNGVPDVAKSELPHRKTDARFQCFEKALLRQSLQRQPDRRSGNPQALGQRDFEYPLSGFELATQNHFAKINQGPAALRLRAVRGLAKALHDFSYDSADCR